MNLLRIRDKAYPENITFTLFNCGMPCAKVDIYVDADTQVEGGEKFIIRRQKIVR